MSAPKTRAEYTVHLVVKVEGPEEDWDAVAGWLARYLLGKKYRFTTGSLATQRRVSYDITSAAVDQATDE